MAGSAKILLKLFPEAYRADYRNNSDKALPKWLVYACRKWASDVRKLSGTRYTIRNVEKLSRRGRRLNSLTDTYWKRWLSHSAEQQDMK